MPINIRRKTGANIANSTAAVPLLLRLKNNSNGILRNLFVTNENLFRPIIR